MPARSERVGAIDGLRGLALLLVVAFHLFGQGRVSGGVDVFLLLSGYFATGSLLRRAEAGRLQLSPHYARTLARLLPAALVVLAAVTVALLTLAPRLRWSSVLREVGASATFWENWQLVRASLDYGAAGPDASPLQHFWSLSVQGQFFAVWPLAVLGLVIVAQRRVRAGRTLLTPGRLVALVTGTATAASFGYALWLVTQDQPTAYFSTFTRFWEIGAGALLALGLRRGLRSGGPHHRQWRAALGWTGLALVVGSGFLIDGADVFPGAWALVPAGGAALVLIATVRAPGGADPGGAGLSASPKQNAPSAPARRPTSPTPPFWAPERFLDSRPLRFGARISYALYLWHWPVLVFWLLLRGADSVGPLAAAGILATSTLLAWLTTRYVAEPVLARVSARQAVRVPVARRTASPGGRRTIIVLTTAAVLVLGSTQVGATRHDATVRSYVADLGVPSPDHPGAGALLSGTHAAPDPGPGTRTATGTETETDPPFRPATWLAYEDHPATPGCAQGGITNGELVECTLVEPTEPTEPTAVVYLVGASHVQQYEPAFVDVAQRAGWELHEMVKHGCRLATSAADDLSYPTACAAWNESALAALVEARPDAVVVTGTRTWEDGGPEQVFGGQADAWRKLERAGITVVTVRDNPRFTWRVPECLSGRTADLAIDPHVCGRPRADVLAPVSPVETDPRVPGAAVHLDLTPGLCGPTTCDAVVGNVLTYRDDDHLTATYARTLGPLIEEQLRHRAPGLFAGPPGRSGAPISAGPAG